MGLLTNSDHEQRLRTIEARLATVERLQDKFISNFKTQDEKNEAMVNLLKRLTEYVESLEALIRDLENTGVKDEARSSIEGEVRSSVQEIIAAGKLEAIEDLFNKVMATFDTHDHRIDALKKMIDAMQESITELFKQMKSDKKDFVDFCTDFQQVGSDFQQVTKIVLELAEKQKKE